MTSNEIQLLDSFLERLSDDMGSAGCNDFELPDTPENRELAGYELGEGEDLNIKDGKIYTYDFIVLGALRKRLKA